MKDGLLQIYYRLPAPARSIAASIHGFRLKKWRYGSETELLVRTALERDSWDAARWADWHAEHIAYVLHRAATRVPYYRELWSTRRRLGDRASWEYLENWPLLSKEALRATPLAFVSDDCDVRRMYHEHTSGTTGKPLDLWWSKQTMRAWFALFEARVRHWNGVSRNDNWAILGGQPVVPATIQSPPYWVWNMPMNQLYLSANHISRHNITAYVHALNTYNITHLVAYSSSVSVLAKHVVELGLGVPSLKVVITNAEALFPWQRQVIQQAFACEVRETYGMAEIVAAASECSAGISHIWPEVGYLEVLSDVEDLPVRIEDSGRLVCTGLLNADMPLIRYLVGDRGRFVTEHTLCACRRTLPAIAGIEGRSNDLLLTSDGRHVYWLNSVFYEFPIYESQIIQETLGRIRVRFVPATGFTTDIERLIAERLRLRMGAIEIVFERVQEIPRSPNGKFRAIVCNVSLEERQQLERAQ